MSLLDYRPGQSVIYRAARVSIALCFLSLLNSPGATAQEKWVPPGPELVQEAREILQTAPLIDTHNDLAYSLQGEYEGDPGGVDLRHRQPELSADIPRLQEGLVGGQFWSAYVATDSMAAGGSLRHALRAIDRIHRIVEAYPNHFKWALTAEDFRRIHREGKIASVIGFEGGHAIENTFEAIRIFHRLNVRYLTLTHFLNTSWADAATDHSEFNGLSEFGEDVVRELNRVGILVDLSHVSAATMKDAIRVSQAPVIFSHSNARELHSHPRNVPDEVLRLLPENGGVVQVNFIASYIVPEAQAWQARRDSLAETLRLELNDPENIRRKLSEWERTNPQPRGHIGMVADHIDHVRRVAGIDHVGIGSDFYVGEVAPMVDGLGDVTRYPYLFAELLRRGYSEEQLRKIAGRNLLRAMREMEEVARTLQASDAAVPVTPGHPKAPIF